jgi:hypothetical protein
MDTKDSSSCDVMDTWLLPVLPDAAATAGGVDVGVLRVALGAPPLDAGGCGSPETILGM